MELGGSDAFIVLDDADLERTVPWAGYRRDVAEALVFAADGKVKAGIELQPLSAINSVLARGDVPSRVVLDFSAR